MSAETYIFYDKFKPISDVLVVLNEKKIIALERKLLMKKICSFRLVPMFSGITPTFLFLSWNTRM
jgi:uncharacterized membrane protein